jgi:peptidyl-prolyl cis-trans isomerase D
MLQRIHDQAQSWIAWVIVGLLIVPFALWGINSYFEGGGGGVVAEVNGAEISLRDYQRSLQQQRQRMRAMLGANYSPELLENPQMRRAVLDAMVENDLISQTVHADGYRINDAILFAQLQQIDAFQMDGLFSPSLYQQVLASQGMSKPFFESSLRNDIMQSQLLTGFRQASYVTDYELGEAVRLQQQQRTARLLTVPASVERLQSREVSDEEVAAQYELNGKRYEIPEQVSLDYIELSVAELAEGVTVEAAEIERLYQERKESLMADEERHASHILIELPEGADDAAVSAAEQRLKEVEEKLAAGESFETLAQTYSDDPGSASAGGDLGFFPRGIMVPEFDDVVFNMAPGETSAPIRTQFGYHLIRLQEIQAAEMRSLEDARAELSREIQRRKAEELFYDHSETISNLAYEEPDTLHGAAAAAQLKVQQSGLFSRQGGASGVVSKPAVVQAAFSGLVLKEGKNSDPIELADDHLVIVRIHDHKPASRKPLQEVRAEVVDAILLQRAADEAHKQGQSLLEQIQQGTISAEQAAEQSQLVWDAAKTVKRDDFALPQEVITRLFQMKAGGGGLQYGGVALHRGGYVLVELSAVEDGSLEALDADQRKQIRRQMAEKSLASHYQSYVASLRNGADIVVFEDQLN